MAFGGNMGAGGALIAATVYLPPLAEAAAADSVLGANGALVYRNSSATPLGGGQKRLDTILIQMAVGATPLLVAFNAANNLAASTDVGVLVTAAAVVNEHGLPTNFGPGRGNWTENARARIRVQILQNSVTALAATTNLIYSMVTLAAGNISILFKNTSAQDVTILQVRLHFDHTLMF